MRVSKNLLLHCTTFTISDSTHLAKEIAKADANFYRVQKEAEANKVGLMMKTKPRVKKHKIKHKNVL